MKSPRGFASIVERRCWIQSVPPAVADGLLMDVRYCYGILARMTDPPATAGGTDCIQAGSKDFRVKASPRSEQARRT